MLKIILFELWHRESEPLSRIRQWRTVHRATHNLPRYARKRGSTVSIGVAWPKRGISSLFLRARFPLCRFEREREGQGAALSSRRTREQACTMEKEGEGRKQKERRILCVSDTLRSCAFETSDARPAALRRAVSPPNGISFRSRQ